MGLFSKVGKFFKKLEKAIIKIAEPAAAIAGEIPGPWQLPARAVEGAFGYSDQVVAARHAQEQAASDAAHQALLQKQALAAYNASLGSNQTPPVQGTASYVPSPDISSVPAATVQAQSPQIPPAVLYIGLGVLAIWVLKD